MENRLYKIQEQVTSGWVDIDEPNTTKLTRDECKSRLLELMQEGYNPNYLRFNMANIQETTAHGKDGGRFEDWLCCYQ